MLEAGIELKDAVQAKCEQLVNNEVSRARCEAMTIFLSLKHFFKVVHKSATQSVNICLIYHLISQHSSHESAQWSTTTLSV